MRRGYNDSNRTLSRTVAWLGLTSNRWRFEFHSVIGTLVLGFLAFVVLYPLGLLILNSFQTARPGADAVFGLQNWRVAFNDPAIFDSIWNTFSITFAVQAISLPLAILLAWIITRTDIPGRGVIEFIFWLSYFIPPLGSLVGWIMLFDPNYGLMNKWLLLLFNLKEAPFNIYSFWGIVFVHLAGFSVTVKVMLLAQAFRNMDATLEEASRAAGANMLTTLVRIVVPVMTPIILVVVLLSTIRTLEAFEVEFLLGTPIRFFVYSTKIYAFLHEEPAQFGPATALGVMILVLMIPFICLQQWMNHKRSYTTITSRFKGQRVSLGAWKWPVFAMVMVVLGIASFIPICFMFMGSFMTLFGFFHIADVWTLAHWKTVVSGELFMRSLGNTLVLSCGAAVVSVAIYSIVAYMSVKIAFSGRSVLDFLTWLPFTLPGIVVSLGLLWFVLDFSFLRALYGSMAILIVVSALTHMTLSVQVFKSVLLQLGTELEEASRICGASWLVTYRRIVVPILLPAILLIGTMVFAGSARSVSGIVLLVTANNQPLSILQLEHMMNGDYGAASVVGTIVVLLISGAALMSRWLGVDVGVHRS